MIAHDCCEGFNKARKFDQKVYVYNQLSLKMLDSEQIRSRPDALKLGLTQILIYQLFLQKAHKKIVVLVIRMTLLGTYRHYS